MEHFLQGNVPLRHLLNAKPLFMFWRRSAFNEVNDWALSEVTSKRDLKALENFVQHYSGKILHSNHYLLMLAKRNYLYISRKNLIELMAKCSLEEQVDLKAAFKNKNDLYKEFWWIPQKLSCADSFWLLNKDNKRIIHF